MGFPLLMDSATGAAIKGAHGSVLITEVGAPERDADKPCGPGGGEDTSRPRFAKCPNGVKAG